MWAEGSQRPSVTVPGQDLVVTPNDVPGYTVPPLVDPLKQYETGPELFTGSRAYSWRGTDYGTREELLAAMDADYQQKLYAYGQMRRYLGGDRAESPMEYYPNANNAEDMVKVWPSSLRALQGVVDPGKRAAIMRQSNQMVALWNRAEQLQEEILAHPYAALYPGENVASLLARVGNAERSVATREYDAPMTYAQAQARNRALEGPPLAFTSYYA